MFLRDTKDIGKHCHAFNGIYIEATIDFGTPVMANNISLETVQNWTQWVFFPQWVKCEISLDGINFTKVKTVSNTNPVDASDIDIQDFTVIFANKEFTLFVLLPKIEKNVLRVILARSKRLVCLFTK